MKNGLRKWDIYMQHIQAAAGRSSGNDFKISCSSFALCLTVDWLENDKNGVESFA